MKDGEDGACSSKRRPWADEHLGDLISDVETHLATTEKGKKVWKKNYIK